MSGVTRFITKCLPGVVVCLTVSSAHASDYKVERISPVLGNNETAIAFSPGNKFVGIKAGPKQRLFTYDISSKQKKEIKKSQLYSPVSINSSGRVVGASRYVYEHGPVHAVIWDPNGKSKTLELLSDKHNYAVAMSVNRAGAVVGYSGIQDTDEPETYRPFIFTDQGGLKEIPMPVGESWAATDIADNGNILVIKLDGRTGTVASIVEADGKVLSSVSLSTTAYLNDAYEPLRTKLVSSTAVAIATAVYDFDNKRKWSPGDSFPVGRDDYGRYFAMNSSGEVVGYRNGRAFLSTKTNGDLQLHCLVPKNSEIEFNNKTLTLGSVIIDTVGGINDAGDIVFSADLVGDGLGSGIYVAKRIRGRQPGGPQSYCPSIKATLECKCVGSNNLNFNCKDTANSGENLNVGESALASGGSCKLSMKGKLGNRRGRAIPMNLFGVVYNVDKCEEVRVFNKEVGPNTVSVPLKTGSTVYYSLRAGTTGFPKDLWQPETIEISPPYDPTAENPPGCFIKP